MAEETRIPPSIPILIIGAGPVGLALSIELRLQGIPVGIIERSPTIEDGHPKGRGNDMRTLEHYRRWGVSDELRQLAWTTPNPRQELLIVDRLLDKPIGVFPLRYGRDPVESRDLVAEPSLSVPQFVTMRVLQRRAVELGVLVWRGWEVVGVEEGETQVFTTVRSVDGKVHRIGSTYLVGCDGPSSFVRRKAGIQQDGIGPLGRTWTYVVRSEGHPIGRLIKGPEYTALGMLMVVNPSASSIISIPGEDEWGFGILREGDGDQGPSDEEVQAYAQRLLGTPTNIRITSRSSFASVTRLSRQYRRGRLFIAGDACHICPPTGAHNMNTGIEDAVNDAERRPVGKRVSDIAMANSLAMREAEKPLNEGGADLSPADKARSLFERTYTQWNSYGVVLDQRYDGSPVIQQEGWDAPAWTPTEYWAQARPGHRAPHLWLADGDPLHDHLGTQFTLLHVGASKEAVEGFLSVAKTLNFPVIAVELAPEIARGKYPAKLTLIRPDQYISWQGDNGDPKTIIHHVTGHIRNHEYGRL